MKSHSLSFGNPSLKFRSSSEASPSHVHRFSIASPSNRWTNDGVSMEYRWSISLVLALDNAVFLLCESESDKAWCCLLTHWNQIIGLYDRKIIVVLKYLASN